MRNRINIGQFNLSILIGMICIVAYIEVLHYKIVASSWITFQKSRYLSLKILFVSDPQLLGLNDEHWLLGPFTRWDSDRFLYKGFQEALAHVQPDVIIFVGDLFDEGSSSTDIQFESYVKRFNKIFYSSKPIKRIIIPGDNDIAREGFNFIESKKIIRFKKFFPSLSKSVSSLGFLDILKFNNYNGRIDQVEFNVTTFIDSGGKFKIIINHFGVLNYLPKLYSTIKEIRPNLIIAGHEHSSAYILCSDCWTEARVLILQKLEDDPVFLSVNISQTSKSEVIQLVIPTCSYRMGFPKMGYGFMELDNSGLMNYTVLWLPDRYNMLILYAWFSCASLTALILRLLARFPCLPRGCAKLFKKPPHSHVDKRKFLSM